jgi:hypothetical protein
MESKKLKRRWRWFTISSLLLIIISVVAISRPLGDSAIDQFSLILPFLSIYYIVFGLHKLGTYEEKLSEKEEREKIEKQKFTRLHL